MSSCNYSFYDDLCVHYDSIMFIQECKIFDLVDILLSDLNRLGNLVLDARERANYFAALQNISDLPYLTTDDGVWNHSFDDHPSMSRYLELYKGEVTP